MRHSVYRGNSKIKLAERAWEAEPSRLAGDGVRVVMVVNEGEHRSIHSFIQLERGKALWHLQWLLNASCTCLDRYLPLNFCEFPLVRSRSQRVVV